MSSSAYRALALSLLSLVVLAGAAGAQEGVAFRVTDTPRENPASATGASFAPKFTDAPADALIVPFFKVDRSNAQGETTLIAVRNVTDVTHDVEISYWVDHVFSPAASPDLVQSFSLIPDQVATINLRDLPAITGGQGNDAVVRGWLVVEHEDGVGDVFSADFFRVNPAQDFATGGRMVDADHSYTCTVWDLRYLVGGLFSGGTRLEAFIDTPLGGNPAVHDPSFTIDFFNEAGSFQGGVEVFSNRQVVELIGANLLALLPGSPSSFGSMVVTFQPGTSGGLITGTFSADDRFSIGINGTCLLP